MVEVPSPLPSISLTAEVASFDTFGGGFEVMMKDELSEPNPKTMAWEPNVIPDTVCTFADSQL